MTAARHHVFTYGSLMFAPVWNHVVRGTYRSTAASVHGFRRLCVRNEEYPAMIVSANAPALQGVVYFDVDEADMARLDHFETASYARVCVAARIGGVAIDAQAYLALGQLDLLDEDWDPAAFERDGLARFLATYAVENKPPA